MDIFPILGRDYDSNVYLVTGKVSTIIDTGTGFYSKWIIEKIQEVVPLTEIKQVLLTHEHYDHVGGVNDIVKATNGAAKIFAHEHIVSKLKDGKSTFAEMIGGKMPKITVDVPLTDHQQVFLGDEPFQVLFTPGHSVGSLCLYSKDQGVLFSGDTLFAHGGFGRYDFPGGDFTLLVQSIERLSGLNIRCLYPGHGPVVETDGADHVFESLRSIRSLL
jgi:glyoxylase-like metal-dependent hydrolase (beta-lactamase superfamily II)